MTSGAIFRSLSTWQQPIPPNASPARRELIGAAALTIVAKGSGRLRVVVDGRSAAGKTSFAHELAATLSVLGRPVLRASLDDFKRPWADRHQYDRESGEGYYRNAFDHEQICRLLLKPAGVDGSGECSLCAIDPLTQIDHSAVVVHAPRDAVLVVDGVFALRPELSDYWDAAIWLDVDPELAILRGVARDEERDPDAESLHRHRYAVAEECYLAEANPVPRASLVIDNTWFAAPRWIRR